MENQGLPRVVVFGLLGVILLFIFGSSMFVTIQPGEKGVKFKRLSGGLDKENIYHQGFKIIAPWDYMVIYNVKEIETFEKMEVLSKDGLSIKVDLSIIHKAQSDKIGYLHDNIGSDYLEDRVKPVVRSVTREVIGNYLPIELYSTKRLEIEGEIYERTLEILEDLYIDVPAILIRDITLPLSIQTAIEENLQKDQEVIMARKEAERKEIEANGISKFQQIVNQTITPQLLKWKGVEATQEISKSTNAKVVVIGNGDGDLPIILGGQ
jgi:regulator of protease activity HflC (stomatin/prohibitin superfamily)